MSFVVADVVGDGGEVVGVERAVEAVEEATVRVERHGRAGWARAPPIRTVMHCSQGIVRTLLPAIEREGIANAAEVDTDKL